MNKKKKKQKTEYVPIGKGDFLKRISVVNNSWPCLMDCHANVITYLKQYKSNYTVLGPDDLLPIVKNEEKMISLILDALVNGKSLIINCDAFNIEP